MADSALGSPSQELIGGDFSWGDRQHSNFSDDFQRKMTKWGRYVVSMETQNENTALLSVVPLEFSVTVEIITV